MIYFACERDNAPNVAVEMSDTVTADELVEAFRAFMLAVGYTPQTVVQHLGEAT